MKRRVRLATSDDIPRMHEIERLCFRGSERLTRAQLEGLALRIDVAPLVVEADGRVEGFALLHFHGRSSRLLTIDVSPGRRGMGFGHALLEAVDAHSRRNGCDSVGLEVRLTNRRAIEVYRKAGYESTGRLRDYYPDDGGGAADALEMEKDLSRAQ